MWRDLRRANGKMLTLENGDCLVDINDAQLRHFFSVVLFSESFVNASLCLKDIENKKLSRCWNSATCEPLDAEIIAAEVQNSKFSIHTENSN